MSILAHLRSMFSRPKSPFRYAIVDCTGEADAPDTTLFIPEDPTFGKTTFSSYGDAVNRIVSQGHPTVAAPGDDGHWLAVKDMKTGRICF